MSYNSHRSTINGWSRSVFQTTRCRWYVLVTVTAFKKVNNLERSFIMGGLGTTMYMWRYKYLVIYGFWYNQICSVNVEVSSQFKFIVIKWIWQLWTRLHHMKYSNPCLVQVEALDQTKFLVNFVFEMLLWRHFCIDFYILPA